MLLLLFCNVVVGGDVVAVVGMAGSFLMVLRCFMCVGVGVVDVAGVVAIVNAAVC